ncbi:HAD-like domain-containing protein [Melanogaster broomeanus]|nr:HAD-like domain-containing protein [Melanogaster broomeanus]
MAATGATRSGLQAQTFHFDKKFVVLSDWDGTITTCDSNDYITDNYGMGLGGRVALNKDILEFDKSGKTRGKSFKDGFELMLASVSNKGHSLEACKTYLTTRSDFTEGFIDFKKFCDATDIPLTIVSSGMDELIRAVLTELAKGSDEDVVKDIAIVSNGVRHDETGKWHITWRHPDSTYGHDKSRAILPYQEYRSEHHGHGPTVFFFGDGVSDLSAAQHADVLFVKVTGDDEKDNLKKHCDKAGIPYIPFLNFHTAKEIVDKIVRGEKSKDDFLVKPIALMN